MGSTPKFIVSLMVAVLMAAFAQGAYAAPIAGETEGVGRDFTITDSLGQTYSIRSTAEINLSAQAVAVDDDMSLSIQLDSVDASTSTILTIDGFTPGRTYHIYLNGEASPTIQADPSGTLNVPVSIDVIQSVSIKTLPSTIVIYQPKYGDTDDVTCEHTMGNWIDTKCMIPTSGDPWESSNPDDCDKPIGTHYDDKGVLTPKTCFLLRDIVGNTIFMNYGGMTLDGSGCKREEGRTTNCIIQPYSSINDGVQIRSSGQNITIKNLTINNGDKCISFLGSATNIIIDNVTMQNCAYGLWMGVGTKATVSNSWISNNSTGSVVLSSNQSGSLFSNNRIELGGAEAYAVQISGTGGHTFTGNTIENNGGGGVLLSSPNNTFYDNKFNNSVNVSGTYAATWNLPSRTAKAGDNIIGGPYRGGNYWANPPLTEEDPPTGFSIACIDNNPWDGICDSSYTVSIDNVPSLNLGTDTLALKKYNGPALNLDPEFALIAEQKIRVGDTLTFPVSATDYDNNYPLTFSASAAVSPAYPYPGDGALTPPMPKPSDHKSENFTWTPPDLSFQGNTYTVRFTVTDNVTSPGTTGMAIEDVDIKVVPNKPPTIDVFTNNALDVFEGTRIEFWIVVSDPEGDALKEYLSGKTVDFSTILPNGTTATGSLPPGASLVKRADTNTYDFAWDTVAGNYGKYTIVLTAQDLWPYSPVDSPAESTRTVELIVSDKTPPAFSNVPDNRLISSADPVVFNYEKPTAIDLVDGIRDVYCMPESGSTLIGNNTVTCDACDAHNNCASASFTVTVISPDIPPTINNVPADMIVEAENISGAVVDFNPTATDSTGNTVHVICDPPSGSTFKIGDTPVNCKATDDIGNTASASFTVTVKDTTPPPTITVPTSMIVEAAGPDGAVVTYTPTATDHGGSNVDVTCTPASGSPFAIGTKPVDCIATDDHGKSANKSFTVTVRDTTAPVITVPANMTVEAAGPAGAEVTYTAAAADIVDGTVTVTCSHASGSTFSIDTTTVTCGASDTKGNAASASFTVTVHDTTAPEITPHDNVEMVATSTAGALVNYTSPATSDAVDGANTASCAPASGTQFTLGDTTVTCDATDKAGNHAIQTTFVVQVLADTAPPQITAPADIIVSAPSASGVNVSFSPTVADNSGAVSVTCTPQSESLFPPGINTVACTAEDGCGNKATASFKVVTYNWTGFFRPVDNPGPDLLKPVVNVAKAGSAIPVKFSLGGNMGLDIFAVLPGVYPIDTTGAIEELIEETVTAGASSLSYDPASNQYTYVWKTSKSYVGMSYQLRFKLKDGTDHYAIFSFK